MTPGRRAVLAGAGAAGLGLVLWRGGALDEWLPPAEVRARGGEPGTLGADEVRTLEAFAEVLLPGAAEAGVAQFVDHHLTVPAAESLLMIRYLDVPPPYADFYRGGLAALDAYSRATAGRAFHELAPARAEGLVKEIAAAPPPRWRGPPSPLLYFAVRADAVDVVYGTEAGFEKLGVPYQPHILPPSKW